jgi:hypothetical protein
VPGRRIIQYWLRENSEEQKFDRTKSQCQSLSQIWSWDLHRPGWKPKYRDSLSHCRIRHFLKEMHNISPKTSVQRKMSIAICVGYLSAHARRRKPKGARSNAIRTDHDTVTRLLFFIYLFIGAGGVVILSLQKHSKVTRLVHWDFTSRCRRGCPCRN